MYAKTACDYIITNKLQVSCTAYQLLDFGVMRSKVMGLIKSAKIACDRIIIRTDKQIIIKLKTCTYLAEPMNCL